MISSGLQQHRPHSRWTLSPSFIQDCCPDTQKEPLLCVYVMNFVLHMHVDSRVWIVVKAPRKNHSLTYKLHSEPELAEQKQSLRRDKFQHIRRGRGRLLPLLWIPTQSMATRTPIHPVQWIISKFVYLLLHNSCPWFNRLRLYTYTYIHLYIYEGCRVQASSSTSN